ncbi:MAG: KilA-N domain-containing protein [Saprospiraceae bacterium]
MKKNILSVLDTPVIVFQQKEEDYFSLTSMARGFNAENANSLIVNWMRNRNTIEFLGVWEQLHNPGFNSIEFDRIRSEAGLNTFILSVKRWVNNTGAIGIQAKAGRYGGTYAHKDIAVQFGYWLSPTFQLHLIQEWQKLKEDESQRLNLDWSLKRQLAKANWHIHTEAVREHLVPLINWNTKKEAIFQASEADMLNLALFGMTSREWKKANPGKKGNLRDYASIEQLLVLANLQALNAKLIEWDSPKEQRLEILNKTAREQMQVLLNTKAVGDIKRLK